MSDPEEPRWHLGPLSLDALRGLIFINLCVWILWLIAQSAARTNSDMLEFMMLNFMAWPTRVFAHWQFHTLLTSAFSQQAFWHLFYNMLALWFLGEIVQQYLGQRNLIVLYLVCGVVGSLAQVCVELLMGSAIPGLGASGAVMGIAVVAAFIEPHRMFYIYGIIPINLWLMVVIYIGLDLSGALSNNDHVAHAAHLGGALMGYLFWRFDLYLFQMRRGVAPGPSGLSNWWRSAEVGARSRAFHPPK